MGKQNVILIFDVGKTNKKILLFDEQYKIVHDESQTFEEITDEDGFACEHLALLTTWIREKFKTFLNSNYYNIKAVNFSAYGASFVYIDAQGKTLTPLYNYLKPYPEKLKKQFYQDYGGESLVAKQTASPVLGNLNSGLQLYRLKYEKPSIFDQIKYSLHLPQYLSYLISGKTTTDITSIGCHTHLWDFKKNDYHAWVYKEKLDKKFSPILSGDTKMYISNNINTQIGIGLHDSSAALIPYIKLFTEPFILISTGTWCISLNPFNNSMLTDYELHNDCLCYLSYESKPVKASRLFAGYEHEEQVKRLAVHFNKDVNYYKKILYDDSLIEKSDAKNNVCIDNQPAIAQQSVFSKRDLNDFKTYEEAYHQLMADIMEQQIFSTKLILNTTPVKKIFVDGGFSKNDVFMNLLASSFPNIKVYAASVAQASALGAALILHSNFNTTNNPSDLIQLKLYSSKKK